MYGKTYDRDHPQGRRLPHAGGVRAAGGRLDALARRPDNWRGGGKPAQRAFCAVAEAIARFEPVTMCVSAAQYQNARARLPEHIRVVEMSANDAWVRDCGPTFLVNDAGELRAVDWEFNAWGRLVDGLYFPWDKDVRSRRRIC